MGEHDSSSDSSGTSVPQDAEETPREDGGVPAAAQGRYPGQAHPPRPGRSVSIPLNSAAPT